jgi:hypothetical protein
VTNLLTGTESSCGVEMMIPVAVYGWIMYGSHTRVATTREEMKLVMEKRIYAVAH